MIDCGFPVIQYERNQAPQDWGRQHGETYRQAIKELVDIRTGLLHEKNPSLDLPRIESLAQQQWSASQVLAPELVDELQGIAEGANVSKTDITILNNYTDFRDIQLDDQGCSLVYVNQETDGPLIGQTWDMHGSAKSYVCCLQIPFTQSDHHVILFSIVGCVGMMGFTSFGTMLGVNNINTDRARAGVMWPVLVRKVLEQPDIDSMATCMTTAPVTSGHNYLLADGRRAQMWEVAPELSEMVGEKSDDELGYLFHTNHCVGEKVVQRETTISLNSTTRIRYDLLQRKTPAIRTLDQMDKLMNDHENYPKSICSNFQTNAQDPSVTCGGAVGRLRTGEVRMWRGDKVYDDNFVERRFDLNERF